MKAPFVSWTTVIALVWVLALLLLAMAIILSFSVDTDTGSSDKFADNSDAPRYALMVCARSTRLHDLWPTAEQRWVDLGYLPILVYVGAQLDGLASSIRVHRVDSVDGIGDHDLARRLWPLYAARLPGYTLLADVSRYPVKVPSFGDVAENHLGLQEATATQRRLQQQPCLYSYASQQVWRAMYKLSSGDASLSALKHRARRRTESFHETCMAWGQITELPRVEDECAVTRLAQRRPIP